MDKHRGRNTAYILSLALAFAIVFPAVYVEASQETETFEAGFLNAERDTEMTINYADPEVSSIGLWANRPYGAYTGASAPGSLYEINDWIIADTQEARVGWFFYTNENLLMAGASEFWLRGPMVTDNAHNSTLSIWKVGTANVTFASLGTAISSTTVDCTNHNVLGMHNGYTAQSDAGEWAKIVALGGTATNPYQAYHHVYMPIYPNTWYWMEQTIEYNHTGADFKPQFFMSDEDICGDEIPFAYYNGTFVSNFPLDPDFAIIFLSGQNGGRAMVKLGLSPGDELRFSFDTTAAAGWRAWAVMLYPDLNTTFWQVEYGGVTAIANGTINLGGFIFSSHTSLGHVGTLMTVTYLGSPLMEDVNIYPPCYDNETYTTTYLYSGGDVLWVDWSIGAMELWSSAPIGINKTMNATRFTDLVTYEPLDDKPTVSIAGGFIKHYSDILVDGARKAVVFTGTAVSTAWKTSTEPYAQVWSYLKWRMPTQDDVEQSVKDLMQLVYSGYQFAGGMVNATKSWISTTLGELVDRVQALWQNGIDWLGNKIRTLIDPIIKFVHEIRDIIEQVVEVIINALEYILTIAMQISIMIFLIPTLICAFLPYMVPSAINRFIESKDPSSPAYKYLREDERE